MEKIIGSIFGYWTVINDPIKIKYKYFCLCKCVCGAEKSVDLHSMKIGLSKSCGCFVKEVTSKTMIKHGMSNTITYNSWAGMIQRCNDNNFKSYKSYGGRGIYICDRWLNSFENFYADMGERPSKEYSIDRINVNGNYEPSNCRWATHTEQQNNKMNNRYITHNNKTQSLSSWAREFNIPYDRLRGRLRIGMPFDKAISL